MIEQLIARVFYARNLAHFEHWKATGTGSFAKHMALGSFYDDVIDAIDTLVEAYQGAFDLIGDIPAPGNKKDNVLATLEADAKWIEDNHDEICRENKALGNHLDTLTGVYLSAIYKLRNLK